MGKRIPIAERFDKYIMPISETGCWIWTGSLDGPGYGLTSERGKLIKAHRYSYERTYGPIPFGYEIDHKCRIRSCVNPAHLEAVTHRENVQRGELGITTQTRQKSVTHCPKGHEYSGKNLYQRKNGSRVCLACARIKNNARYHAKYPEAQYVHHKGPRKPKRLITAS